MAASKHAIRAGDARLPVITHSRYATDAGPETRLETVSTWSATRSRRPRIKPAAARLTSTRRLHAQSRMTRSHPPASQDTCTLRHLLGTCRLFLLLHQASSAQPATRQCTMRRPKRCPCSRVSKLACPYRGRPDRGSDLRMCRRTYYSLPREKCAWLCFAASRALRGGPLH